MKTHTDLFLYAHTKPPTASVIADRHGRCATITLNGGDAVIFAEDPASLLVLADTLQDAARQLHDALDKAAARDMAAAERAAYPCVYGHNANRPGCSACARIAVAA